MLQFGIHPIVCLLCNHAIADTCLSLHLAATHSQVKRLYLLFCSCVLKDAELVTFDLIKELY